MARWLGILGVEDSPYVQELERAANNETDVQVSKLRYADLRSSTNDAESGHELDALLVRSMPLGSLEQVIFRMDCLQRMADQGVRVINSPKTLETAIDKWLTVHRLEQAGLSLQRRAVIAMPESLQWWLDCNNRVLKIEFSLTSGAYATSLLRELVNYETSKA